MKWICTYIWPTRQKGTIPSRMEPHPLIMMGDSHPGWIHIRSQWWKISCTYIWPTRQKGTIPSRLEPNPLIMMGDSHPGRNHICSQWWKIFVLTSNLVGTESYTLVRMAPSPWLSYMVTDHAPPLSRRVAIALTSILLDRMANTHIWHGRNLIL